MPLKTITRLRALLADYVEQNADLFAECGNIGWVTVYRGKCTGWTRLINDAQHWVPGVVAVPVDPADEFYITTGGDDQRGAESWILT